MRFTQPAGLLLALLAIPIVVLHILRPRRPAVTVSSTWLWRELSSPVSAAQPWQRLRPSVLLLLQLLAVMLLALAVAGPARTTTAPLSPHTVFIIDTSGSMAATDGSPDRLAEAVDKARSLRRELPARGVASIVAAGPQPRVVLSASSDRRAFGDALRGLRTTAARADFATAIDLAASLETPGLPIGLVLVSDGGVSDPDKRELPAGLRYVRVGDRAANRGITRLVVEPEGSGLRALVSVRHHGGPAVSQTLRLDVDGRTRATLPVRLGRGETIERRVELPAGDRVEAFLEGEDLLAADDHAFAVAGRRPAVRVLVAGEPNPFLDHLLAALPGVVVERSPVATSAAGFDLAVYDRVAVPADPGAPFLAIAPPGGVEGVAVTGQVEGPAVTLVADDPLLADIDLSEVVIGTAQRLAAPADEALVAAEATPLLVRGSRVGRPFLYLGFALDQSDLPLQVAFPILGDRIVETLSGLSIPPSDLRVGQPLIVPPGVTVRRPGGSTEVVPAAGGVVAERPGFHTIEQEGRPPRHLAVNADAAESAIAPEASLPIPEPKEGERTLPRGGERPLLPWAVAAIIVTVAVEYLVARRQVGVARRQWRIAGLLRLAVVVLLVGALVGLALPRPGRQVATVFLIDASDSMGDAGRADAIDWVRTALASSPAGARAGVAFFGADARLELTVQRDAQLIQPATAVDASRTNLAGALRLAAAVLPSDARRRIVVVSDGRANEGDARSEAAKLRAEGIRVDVHAVARPSAADVAVVRVDAPPRASIGEDIPLRVTIRTSSAAPVRLTLEHDDVVVDERVLELPAGDHPVELVRPAASPGVARFRVTATRAGDRVPQNDVGHAAVEVVGASKVLVVEGTGGNGDALGAALRASGLTVETIVAAQVPGVDRLAGFHSTVLVDVDARSLSAAQLEALTVATRDLGRGLVAVGGDHSYALGGYRDSPLEALLPVISDITDPKRRDSVAEVLAIDTSGSMGACHCAEGANGMVTGGNSRGGGGVNKTDISRAGAARAIAALSANDLVGVIAFNADQKAVLPLQKVPPEDVVTKGLSKLKPDGSTDINAGLERAAQELRDAKAKLRHIILFTDGFTPPANLTQLEEQAAALAAEGITVSVLATGEGSTAQLAAVAAAGKGRFYPGRDLSQVPEILMQEAVLASRNFVNEGTFFPKITASTAATDGLQSTPPLLGYIATTAKASAATSLRLGDDEDPLLASWTTGLGRVSAWTSDASARWSQPWAAWDGYVGFWSAVVRETFPASGGTATLRATVVDDRLRLNLEGATTWPDDATATATVTGPGLDNVRVALERTSGTTFAAELPANGAGTFAAGASVTDASGPLGSATALATQSYSAEYRPESPDAGALVAVSRLSGGRGEIAPGDAFDIAGLPVGRARIPLAGWLLLAAAILWPVAVACSRVSLQGGQRWQVAARGLLQPAALRDRMRRRPVAAPPESPPAGDVAPAPAPPAADQAPPPVPAPETGTLGRLLDRKRSSGGDPPN